MFPERINSMFRVLTVLISQQFDSIAKPENQKILRILRVNTSSRRFSRNAAAKHCILRQSYSSHGPSITNNKFKNTTRPLATLYKNNYSLLALI